MNFLEFKNTLFEIIVKKVGNDHVVSLKKIQKNNGVYYEGIVIMNKKDNIAPAFCLENYYEEYMAGSSLNEIADDIITVNENNGIHRLDADPCDFESIKHSIMFKLINYDMNSAILREVPFRRFLDLARVYYIYVDGGENKKAGILIRNEHLGKLGVDRTVIDYYANMNTPIIEPVNVFSMEEIMKDTEFSADGKMHILTNSSSYYGAACLAYPGIEEVLDRVYGSDLYILPSSVHECATCSAA